MVYRGEPTLLKMQMDVVFSAVNIVLSALGLPCIKKTGAAVGYFENTMIISKQKDSGIFITMLFKISVNIQRS